MTSKGIDTSLALHLNTWGIAHKAITVFAAKEVVYLVIALGLSWLAVNTYRTITPFSVVRYLKRGVLDGLIILAIPVGIATLISELISQIYFRPRPFVALTQVHLLTPHSADGGMPSHHTVFMIGIASAIYIRNRLMGLTLGVLTIICGVARVAAGIHYPTDVLAGVAIGISSVVIVNKLLKNDAWRNVMPRASR